MNKEDFERIKNQANERTKNYTSLENLLFICELLDLEGKKYKLKNNKLLSQTLIRYSIQISDLIDLVLKDLERELNKYNYE